MDGVGCVFLSAKSWPLEVRMLGIVKRGYAHYVRVGAFVFGDFDGGAV